MRALSTAAGRACLLTPVALSALVALLAMGACGEAPPDAADATLATATELPARAHASGGSDAERAPSLPDAESDVLAEPREDAQDAQDADETQEEKRAPSPALETPVRPEGEPCPDDMIAVDTTYCPDVERQCIDAEHDPVNNLDICHAYAHRQHCRLRPRRIAFCIDRYEYPNRKGAHPTWMLDWYQAQATCESAGKRLCYAAEWTAACEGPDRTPFPYGWERNHAKCNVDNFFIEPKRWSRKGQFLFYSKDPDVAVPELARLDESVPSGSLEACTSGYGVADMTGNLDEWVVSDVAPREKSLWAGLKGGAWGHVRSQCRPITYSHDPGFSYYFVGFRCCRNAEGAPPWTPSGQAMRAPLVEPHDYAPEPIVVVHPAGPSKTKFTRSGHSE